MFGPSAFKGLARPAGGRADRFGNCGRHRWPWGRHGSRDW